MSTSRKRQEKSKTMSRVEIMRPENYQAVQLGDSNEYEIFIGPNHPE